MVTPPFETSTGVPPHADTALNAPQREAVEHTAGPLVVFAGAGSGKTRVITHRVAHLVQQGVRPWQVLAVTFTNKAAREMRERLDALLPLGAGAVWVGTFHAICAKLLRLHAEACGVRSSFVIYDDSDQKALLTRVVRSLELDERRYAPKLLAWHINTAKQELKSPEDLPSRTGYDQVVQRVYETYQQRLDAAGALDFGDLIFRLVRAMRADAALLQALQARYAHILVDEFQDTNRAQLELVRLLSAEHCNLCVVGDDDQSIYRWRGADRRNILDFKRYFADARLVKLEQNYRSTARILRVANHVIARNLDREPKTLWTDLDDGPPVTVAACADERAEANTLLDAVRVLQSEGFALSDIAILYRVHAQSRVVEETLRVANVRYRIIGGMRFYERAEVKDVLAYLRVVHNPDDDISLLRVINTPARGIGKTTVERLLDQAARQGCSVWTALGHIDAAPGFGAAARTKLRAFVDLVERLRTLQDEGPAALAEAVVEETGYIRVLREQDTAEADARIENVEELVSSLYDYEAETEEPTLSGYLESVTLNAAGERGADEDGLTLMTVHAAKGLEYPVVFVTGMEEEMFPNRGSQAVEDPDHLEEERRLAYVAFTRARRHLLLSHALTRRIYGQVQVRRRSRFIDEMPPQDLREVGLSSVQAVRSAAWSADPYQDALQPGERDQPREAFCEEGDSFVDASDTCDLGDGMLRPGMRVRHPRFGAGKVLDVTDDMQPKATVRFAEGTKRIAAAYLQPG